ncbi:MAG: putative oxidoreductase YdgJ [Planctomycetota bacterium]|jgi:predicted dehydrogenase
MRRVLVVGTGSIGERHVRCFQATGRADVSICEPLESRRVSVQEKYGLSRAFAGLDAVRPGQFDAAVICTPASLHIAQACELASLGLDLLIEKPLSTSLEQIDRLQSIVRERERKAAVAYVLRTHPAIVAMREAIVEGRFGRPVQAVVTSGQHFPTYRPAYREIYYRDRATGGGAIQDALTHLLNAGEFLLGPIDRLVGDAAHQVLADVTVEDTAHVLARHGRVLASYAMNQYQAPNETIITVVCERGTVRFEGHLARWSWMTEPGNAWQFAPAFEGDRDRLFVVQAEAFLDYLDGKRAPACSLEDGLQTLRVNLATLQSVDRAGWIEVRG